MMMTKSGKTYSELMTLATYEERLEYCRLNDRVGEDNFAHRKHESDTFLKTKEWRRCRDQIIVRDLGKDLGVHEIPSSELVFVHHLNPRKPDDDMSAWFDPENLITMSKKTHTLVHYGGVPSANDLPIERSQYDTAPWKKKKGGE